MVGEIPDYVLVKKTKKAATPMGGVTSGYDWEKDTFTIKFVLSRELLSDVDPSELRRLLVSLAEQQIKSAGGI